MLLKRSNVLIVLFIFVISTSACGKLAEKTDSIVSGVHDADPQFHDFYQRLGGGQILGPVISHLFTHGQISYQYTLAGLMAYDPLAPEHERYYLAPLGLDLGILEAVVQPPDDPSLRYVDGHVIEPQFLPLYQELGGARVTGRPLTEARYNPAKERVEQYFENLGFYRTESDLPGVAHLLAYGQWKCGTSCLLPSISFSDASVESPIPPGPEFRKAVDRLGQSFTGFAICPPYDSPDGTKQQVFENVVLAVPNEGGGRLLLYSTPATLGIVPEPLVFPSNDPRMFFYPVSEGKGYNVPQIFLDYLAQHGGLDAAGPPISELLPIGDGIYRQCFSNLCLEEHAEEAGTLRIRPAPLGFNFWRDVVVATGQEGAPESGQLKGTESLDIGQPRPVPTQVISQPVSEGVIVNVWKKYPVIAPGHRQEIGVVVLRENLPMVGVHMALILTLSDGESARFEMEPSGSDGQSYYLLEAMDAPLGEPIVYQVCVYHRPGEVACVQDSFLIWK